MAPCHWRAGPPPHAIGLANSFAVRQVVPLPSSADIGGPQGRSGREKLAQAVPTTTLERHQCVVSNRGGDGNRVRTTMADYRARPSLACLQSAFNFLVFNSLAMSCAIIRGVEKWRKARFALGHNTARLWRDRNPRAKAALASARCRGHGADPAATPSPQPSPP